MAKNRTMIMAGWGIQRQQHAMLGQIGGDSHLMNFGAFVTPEDNILFDVNDFDETLPGVDFTVDLTWSAWPKPILRWFEPS